MSTLEERVAACESDIANLKVALTGSGGAKDPAVAALVDAVAPFGRDSYGRPFKTQAEAEDWHRRVAESEAQGTGQHLRDVMQPHQEFDLRTGTRADVEFFGAFYDELHLHVGPTSVVQKLSHFMDYGASEHNKTVPEIPGMGEWTTEHAMSVKAGQWDMGYRGPLRAILAKHRNVVDI